MCGMLDTSWKETIIKESMLPVQIMMKQTRQAARDDSIEPRLPDGTVDNFSSIQ